MQSRRSPQRRTGHPSAIQSWGAAMLALAPLSGLIWVVQVTGVGIA